MVGSICRNGQVLVISAHHTVHRYTGTPHHVLSCESQRAPQWVGHHPPKKKALTKKKSIHNFSQLFTTFHIFSQLFTTFRQPSQFCSSFRVVKICENLSHFVKICEMHTPREAPVGVNGKKVVKKMGKKTIGSLWIALALAFFLINCWSSVVASVCVATVVQSPLPLFSEKDILV